MHIEAVAAWRQAKVIGSNATQICNRKNGRKDSYPTQK